MAKKALYIGLFLDASSKVTVINAVGATCGQVLEKVLAHHLTLKFKPAPEEVLTLPIGAQVSFLAIGYGADEKAQALLCYMPDNLPCANDHPHVTVAVADGIKPVYSNELLAQGHTLFDTPIWLTARVGWFDGRDDRFDFKGSIYEESP